jgi:iron complex outermembrane receptor protein
MSLIKKAFFLTILFFNLIYTHAQQEVKGKVLDSENNISLANVHIVSIKDSSIVISNKKGEFKIKNTGIYKFTRIGYHEKIVKIVDFRYVIVQMNVKSSQLNEVIVSTNHLPIKLKKSVVTINILSTKEIERGNNVNITPILNRVPGIFMHTGALNTNRITIRGIGSRNLFGTAKIRAYFGDIPLTTGNGETTIEDFELNAIARLEIIKGAASSIYGAGLGGTIHLMPKKSYINDTTIESELIIGSFGLTKGILTINHGDFKNSFRAIYSNTHSDGYRDNNKYDRQTFTITSNHYFREKDELSFVGSYVDLKAFIPSSINEETFINNPTSAAFTWAGAKGFEDTKRGVFGLSWKHNYKDNIKQSTSLFTSFRESNEARPFNILTENTFAIGIRSRFLGNTKLFEKKLDWTVGGELFRDYHRSKTFKNLYQDFLIGTGSVQGGQLSNFKEKRIYFNLFLETNYHFNNMTMFSVGLNFNKTSYNLDDKFMSTDNNPDQSGNYEFKGIFSPKLGISHLITENISLYTNISHGFSPPTISETLLPDGQINTAIKPETGWNFEIGTRGNIINNKLLFNIALFRLDIRNLLVARRTAEDQFIGVNAGKTQHDGLELSLNYDLIDTKTISINSYLSYSLNNFIFKEFIDDEQDFSDNKLTGVPSDIFNTGIDINTGFGLYGSVNFQYVGSIPITDSNSLFSDSYNLSNIKIGYKLPILKKLTLNTFLGVDNIFDEVYASQILINARSFGGRAPRYFYPGNPLNYYMGFHLNYVF